MSLKRLKYPTPTCAIALEASLSDPTPMAEQNASKVTGSCSDPATCFESPTALPSVSHPETPKPSEVATAISALAPGGPKVLCPQATCTSIITSLPMTACGQEGISTSAGEDILYKSSTTSKVIKSPLPLQSTSDALIKRAIDNLQSSRHCLWIGDAKNIIKKCDWVRNGRNNTYTLMWKKDCSSKPTESNDVALVGWLGQVTPDGSNLTPDAGWIYASSLRDDEFVDHQRSVVVERPSPESEIPTSFWDSQMKGSEELIEHARYKRNVKIAVHYKKSFYNKESSTLLAQSPVVHAPPKLVIDPDEEYDSDEDEDPEEQTEDDDSQLPETHRFHTWNIFLPRVKRLYDELIREGYKPQAMEAYDQHNRLIHPNSVYPALSGSISYVYATLEKQLYFGDQYPGGEIWRFYANLVKVRVTKSPTPANSVATKRSGFHLCDLLDTNYSDSHDPTSSKRMKYT